MDNIVKELANKYGRREILIRFLFTICKDNGNTLEESICLIEDYYNAKAGAI